MPVDEVLPPDIAQGATLRGNEYGWSISCISWMLWRVGRLVVRNHAKDGAAQPIPRTK